MYPELCLILLITNMIGIFAVWLRIESRLSRLEGRFSQFIENRKEVKP